LDAVSLHPSKFSILGGDPNFVETVYNLRINRKIRGQAE
jgi:hypothetical protein